MLADERPEIGVEVWLPTASWNGKFQAVGNGGWSIDCIRLARAHGYAAASTDTGHKGDSASFALIAGKLVDFAWRGVHLTAVRARRLSTVLAAAPSHSYWNGCSSEDVKV
jgi:feruloyl esterase